MQLFIQELFIKDSLQGAPSSTNGEDAEADFAAAKVAHELFSKEPLQKALGESFQNRFQQSLFKFANLIIVFPSLKKLPPAVVSMLKGVWEEGGKMAYDATTPSPHQGEGEIKKSSFQTPLAEGGLPITLANVRTVLSILYYFAKHINTLERESFDALQVVMQPLIDQLIQPVKKTSGGEWKESKHPELLTREKVDNNPPLMEKRTPIPSDIRQKPEKALGDHTINRNPSNPEPREYRYLDPNPGASTKDPLIRIQGEGNIAKSHPTSPTDLSFKQRLEREIPSSLIPQDRTTILAAPFPSQYPISTAPYKKRKKTKDPREQEEETLEDEEDPFQEEKF
jgi:hypothetical protein